jgi:peptide chain release factor subunit 1
MVSKQDLERIIAHDSGGREVLSLFLDMSVNSDNKRTHRVFLNQRRAQFDELDSDRTNQSRTGLAEAFQRVESWLDTEYAQENRGIVIYTELGGDWFEAFQFPVTVPNRMIVSDRPSVGPLAQVLESYDHHGVVLLDRERVRILSVYLGTLLEEIEIHGEPYPTPHDVQAGGYSQMRFQRRKLEEMRHFFKEFAKEVEDFVRRYQPRDLIVLGTDENVARFREFLSENVTGKIIYTGPMWVDESTSEILSRIEPHLEAERDRESRELIQVVRERVRQDYLATAGFQSTLVALQEGKVDTLLIEENQQREGARCTQCGFVFGREVERCPYDGSPANPGVDVVEEAIRLAEAQGADIEFVPAGEVQDLAGVAALLRF